MARVRTVEERDYTRNRDAGTEYMLGPFAIPEGRTRAKVFIDRTKFHTSESLTPGGVLRIEISFDGGRTWRRHGAVGFQDGQYLRRDGTVATYTARPIKLPSPELASRRLRCFLTVDAPVLVTALDLDDDPPPPPRPTRTR